MRQPPDPPPPPSVTEDFSVLKNGPTGCGAHPAAYSLGTGVLSHG